jgi:hypothetical protein
MRITRKAFDVVSRGKKQEVIRVPGWETLLGDLDGVAALGGNVFHGGGAV